MSRATWQGCWLWVVIGAPSALGQVIYVDQTATGADDGSSWASAFTRLENALGVATAGFDVWVAEGTYKPSLTGDVAASFVVQSGAAVYGGFAGTESSLAERDVDAHPTILSGDLSGDTGASFANLDDNSRSVVRMAAVSSQTRLDGLIIENGYNGQGGGIALQGGTPSIEGCVLRWNVAVLFGGGMFSSGQSTIRGCVFHDNRAAEGGGLDLESIGSVVERSRFVGNVATFGSGGAIWSIGGINLSSCIFNGNQAQSASAIYSDIASGGAIRASTFFANSANDVGAQGGGPAVSNCIFSSDAGSARFADPLGGDGIAGTLDDDLRLLPGSPFIDAGDNAHVTPSMLLDIGGLPRRVDDPDTPDTGLGAPPLIDKGAHEYQPCPAPTSFCIGAPNSVGPGASMGFVGSAHLYAHDMLLTSSGLPPLAVGLFYHGDQAIQVPFGNGFRCVGGTMARVGIVVGDASGVAEIVFDPATSSVPIAAGDERLFQHWYRNPAAGGAGFNLSNGLRIVFCP